MLNDLSLFVAIANAGSLKNAADTLNLPAATVSRRLQNLEYRLNCQLLHRSSRQFKLTSQGEVLFNECGDLVEDLEQRLDNLGSSANHLSGKIKLLAPSDLARGPLSNVWTSFLGQHPSINLEFVLDNRIDDLRMMQADFAIRIGPQKSSTLHQKRITSIRTLLVAAPSYLLANGIPQQPDDLPAHQLIVTAALQSWKLCCNESKAKFCYKVEQPRAIVNEVGLVKQLVLDGAGISLLPKSEICHELENGSLVQVISDWEGPKRHMYVVWPSGKHINRRSQLLISHLISLVAQNSGFT